MQIAIIAITTTIIIITRRMIVDAKHQNKEKNATRNGNNDWTLNCAPQKEMHKFSNKVAVDVETASDNNNNYNGTGMSNSKENKISNNTSTYNV